MTTAVDSLIEGYRQFRNGVYRQNEARYRALAEGAQTPKAIIIACSDSRADPAMIFNTDPGELFVVRNVANIIPPYEAGSRFHGTGAALEFAVTGLGIGDVIVMGHARCGGINALYRSLSQPVAGEFLPNWIDVLRPVAEDVARHSEGTETEVLRNLEKAAVVHTIETLRTFPFIREREASGAVRLHGWFYGIASGKLSIYDPKAGAFADVAEG